MAGMGDIGNEYRILTRRFVGKSQRWDDNIKINLRDVICEDGRWI